MAKMAKHTPGPWDVTAVSRETGNVSVGQRDLRIVIAEVTNAASFGDMLSGAMRRGGGGFEQGDCHAQFANARLIAAAPDLLEALRQVLASLVATTSLIIRAEDMKVKPSKAVASDKMFLQMLKDYDAATMAGRSAIEKAEDA